VLLLEAGAFTALRNERGQTALEIATAMAREDQLHVLDAWQPLGLSAEGLALPH
jgi:ankyrin repeat protein